MLNVNTLNSFHARTVFGSARRGRLGRSGTGAYGHRATPWWHSRARNLAASHRAHVPVVLVWFLPVKGRPISRSPDSAFRPAQCLRMMVPYVVLLVNDTEAFPDLGVS
ncbi:MAG: hypothetical protein EB033_11715 [Proteobacteria bacterium]|nr:hypothetical protein [Pseudomonadota bacterium]NCV01352.1 hypothetical protein [Pseudomonadota bacterium]NDB73182.1 hypothetical protein [Pseudomonadota bacterium]NDG99193.1 hypothetical protein [Pseudomonadota bacterium]